MNEKRSFRFWQMGAKFYTPLQEKKFKKIYDEVVELSKKYIRNKSVLEIACGTGQFTYPLAPRSFSWIASDYSPNMIEEAQKHNHTKATFCIQHAMDLRFPDESFDVVYMANALHLMKDPAQVLSQAHRVLKGAGLLIVPTFVYEKGVNLVRLKCMETVGLEIVSEWSTATLCDFISQHGFKVIDCEVISESKMVEAFVVAKKIC